MRYTVIVRHPETDAPMAVLEGKPVPDWAEGLVHEDDLVTVDATADDASGDDGQGDATGDAEEPPRSGKGSAMGAWNEYAASLGIEVPADASRDDIFALVDAHKAAAGNGDGSN